jgi:hypothetical protein
MDLEGRPGFALEPAPLVEPGEFGDVAGHHLLDLCVADGAFQQVEHQPQSPRGQVFLPAPEPRQHIGHPQFGQQVPAEVRGDVRTREPCVVVACGGCQVTGLVPQELRHAVGDGVAGGGVDPLIQRFQDLGEFVVEGVLVLAADLLDLAAAGVRVLAEADLRAPEVVCLVEVDRHVGSVGQVCPGGLAWCSGHHSSSFPGTVPSSLSGCLVV